MNTSVHDLEADVKELGAGARKCLKEFSLTVNRIALILRPTGEGMDTSIYAWLYNVSFWSAFFAWLLAQCTKMMCDVYNTHRLNFGCLISIGGMPSAHSAMVSALATSVGLSAGFGSPVFATTLALAFVVMFDASTVRRSAGLQARLLNQIVEELFKEHRLSHTKLRELLGHTRLEVLVGMVMGILAALLVNAAAITWMENHK